MSDAAKFDDELLSAYLDDELSAEERARVEQHLEANPQARHLLDELRGVSQAIQSLPPAKLGVDLSDSIVRQAERAAKEEAKTAVGGASDAAWSMPIGRSKRSWFWAATALAAGLLLMFYERGVNERGDMPNQVAMRDGNAALKVAREPMGRMEMRAAESAVAEDRSAAKDEAVDRYAVSPAAPAAATPKLMAASESSSGNVVLERGRGAVPSDAKRDLGFATRSAATAGSTVVEDTVAQDIVVVHVNTTPEAIRNRVFDAVLVNNSIEPERQTRAAASDGGPGDVDVVLVEAAPLQIYGCMDALKKDSKNYLAIEVDEQSVANQRVKKLDDRADHFAGYNRGIVPAEQKVASNRFYYSQLDAATADRMQDQADKVTANSPQEPGLPLPEQQQARQLEALEGSEALADATESNDASAGAPATVFGSGDVAGGPPSSGTLYSRSTASDEYYGTNLQSNARRAVQKIATKADMLQVLFVLSCPSETPPSPAAAPVSEPSTAPQPATSPATDDSLR